MCEALSDDSVDSLCEALAVNRTVVKLLLGGRELRKDAAVALGRALEATSSLQQLTWVVLYLLCAAKLVRVCEAYLETFNPLRES